VNANHSFLFFHFCHNFHIIQSSYSEGQSSRVGSGDSVRVLALTSSARNEPVYNYIESVPPLLWQTMPFQGRSHCRAKRVNSRDFGGLMGARYSAYLTFLFRPFFRWWWAAVTGFASIFSVLVTPQSGIVVRSPGLAVFIFIGFTMVFLTLSILVQCWDLYLRRHTDLQVAAIQKSKEYGGEYVAALRGELDVPVGALVELRRPVGENEILFALLEIRNRTTRGNYVGVPIWTSAGHQRDYFGGKFAASELVVVPHVQRDTLVRVQTPP
jgi:hypothetical protein